MGCRRGYDVYGTLICARAPGRGPYCSDELDKAGDAPRPSAWALVGSRISVRKGVRDMDTPGGASPEALCK